MDELQAALADQSPPSEVKERRHWVAVAVLGSIALVGLLFALSGGRRDEPPAPEVAEPAAPLPSELYELVLPAWAEVDESERPAIEARIAAVVTKADSVILSLREKVKLPEEAELQLYAFVANFYVDGIPGLHVANGGSSGLLESLASGQPSFLEENDVWANHFWISFAPLLAKEVYNELQASSSLADATNSIAARGGLRPEKLTESLEQWAASVEPPPGSTLRHWALAKLVIGKYADEGMALVRAVQLCPRSEPEDWRTVFVWLREAGQENHSVGRSPESLACWSEAADLAARENDDVKWAYAMASTAYVLEASDPARALETARAATERLEQVAEPPLDTWAYCQRMLGSALMERHHYQEAGLVLRKTLGKVSATDSPAPATAVSLQIALAAYCQFVGEYTEAERLLRAAIKTIESQSQPMHEGENFLAQSRMGLGNSLLAMGRRGEGIAELEAALDLSASIRGKQHRSYPEILFQLGTALLGTERGAELLSELSDIRQRIYGVKHPTNAVAVAAKAMAEYKLEPNARSAEEALGIISGGLETIKESKGADHPSTLGLLNFLVTIYADRGRYDEARPFAEEAARVAALTYGEGHPNLAMELINLAITTTDPADLRDVVDRLALIVPKLQAQLGENHATFTGALNALGFSLNVLGDRDAAKVHLERAVDIARENHQQAGSHLPRFLLNLGYVRRDSQDIAAAIDCFLEAAALFEVTRNPYWSIVARNAAAAVSAYEKHALIPHEAYQALYAAGETESVFAGYQTHIISGGQVISDV